MNRATGLAIAAVIAAPIVLALALVLFLVLGDGGQVRAADTAALQPGAAPPEYAALVQQAADDCDEPLPAVVLAAQLEQESGWNPDAVSPAGAQGIAQFMPGTWQEWGRGGSPFDPHDAIPAQGRFMCHLMELAAGAPQYSGSAVELALAGYNAGWGAVQRYRGVPPVTFASGETHHYVQTIMANVSRLSAAEAGPSDWTAPVDAPVGAQYRQQSALWSSGYHTGVDFTAPTGTTVRAASAGEVITAGRNASYGIQIVISHPDGTYSQYAHLSRSDVTAGQNVATGEAIGLVGSTGNTTGPHLHFEIRTGPEYGTDIDPVLYLRDRGVQL
ncbi:peptidoglycan DD-metalloendopeptidase family protein [Streptomyces bohaiensis]|uniref:peptidoglycan DD-metalloendopeptidase family protein n=1 Tax=Streptomyces bohaiensis TaxID=1431344 RepID=UPI003B76C4FE